MDYVGQMRTLKRARYLWGLMKRLRSQIGDEQIDANKTYQVSVKGSEIISLANISSTMFKDSKQFNDILKRT